LREVLEDRYDQSSTVITSQLPTKTWHQAIGEATMAGAICDRLVHNAHVVTLRGGSMRKKKAIDLGEQLTTRVATLRPRHAGLSPHVGSERRSGPVGMRTN
jgi:hypothetical protein